MLPKEQLNHCKQLLKERQATLIKQKQDGNDRSMMLTEMSGELSSYDNHPADLGTALFEKGKDQALERHAEKELEQINEALHAMEEGTYGLCVVCGEDIGFERLQIVPMAAHCTEHAKDQAISEETNHTPSVFQPHIGWRDHAYAVFEEDGRPNAWSEVEAYGTSETPEEDEVDS